MTNLIKKVNDVLVPTYNYHIRIYYFRKCEKKSCSKNIGFICWKRDKRTYLNQMETVFKKIATRGRERGMADIGTFFSYSTRFFFSVTDEGS